MSDADQTAHNRRRSCSRPCKARPTMETLRSTRDMRSLEDELSIRIELGQDKQWAQWMLKRFDGVPIERPQDRSPQ